MAPMAHAEQLNRDKPPGIVRAVASLSLGIMSMQPSFHEEYTISDGEIRAFYLDANILRRMLP